MRINVNQHYVPQYYLRQFAQSDNLTILDTQTKRIFSNSVQNTGYKKDFYDINPFFLDYYFHLGKEAGRQFVDECINNYNEKLLSPFINKFDEIRLEFENDKDGKPRLLNPFG